MNLKLIKTNGLLDGYTDEDKAIIEKWPNGTFLKTKTTKPREQWKHKKYFAMLNYVVGCQEKYTTKEILLNELKLRLGHCVIHIAENGKVGYILDSISFAKMDDIEFNEFYDRSLQECINMFNYIKTVDVDEYVNNMVRF